MNTSTGGIFQSDIIIRSMLVKAMEDLRANQWLLDFIFVSLEQDPDTSLEYGHKQMAEAKRWFLATNVPVFHTLSITAPTMPCITVSMVESGEGDKTTADTHYDTDEPYFDPLKTAPDIVAGPFVPKSYDPLTNTIELPDDVASKVFLAEGMLVVESNGIIHRVTEVLDDATALIDGIPGDFNGATLRYATPRLAVMLESVQMKESYLLGVHVNGPPLNLMILHTIIVFCLRRYNQRYLELRGFENASFSSTDFSRLQTADVEAEYSRYINLSGVVHHYWPKDQVEVMRPGAPATVIKVIGGETVSLATSEPTNNLSWLGDEDSITPP